MIIDKLNPIESAAFYFIGPRLLKLCGDDMVNYITFTINQSIDFCVIFDISKKTRVTPIVKSGDKGIAQYQYYQTVHTYLNFISVCTSGFNLCDKLIYVASIAICVYKMSFYLRNKTSVPVFYRGNKI